MHPTPTKTIPLPICFLPKKGLSNLDLVLMQKQILGIESQSGSRLEAANVSKDGGISNKDLVILQKHILGISQIDQ